MGLEGRGLVLQEGLPIFFFPLMDHCHSREGQGRWNPVASSICLYLQEFVFWRERIPTGLPTGGVTSPGGCWKTEFSFTILWNLSRIFEAQKCHCL